MTDTTLPVVADVASEIATIENTIRDRPQEYWRDDGLQTRYRDLIAARETGAKAPAPLADAAKERAEIERVIREEPSKYWGSEEMRRRYLQLLAEENGIAATREKTWRASPAQSRKHLDPAVVKNWDASGDFDARLSAVQDSVERIVRVVAADDPERARRLLGDFETLFQPSVRNAILDELALPATGLIRPATDEEMAQFESTPEGKTMARWWGSKARRNVAIVRHRINRVVGRLDAASRSQLIHWINNISATEAMGIYEGLAR